ncbi:MAG: hypothetical protein ABJN43_13450 [Sneathiella sp.]
MKYVYSARNADLQRRWFSGDVENLAKGGEAPPANGRFQTGILSDDAKSFVSIPAETGNHFPINDETAMCANKQIWI